MGSSSKKHSKRVSSKVGRQRKKDKFKKRHRRDVSSHSSDEYSSSTDSEDKRKLQKKNKKKVKRRSQRSPSAEARPRSKGKVKKRRSRSVERQITNKKKRKLPLSSHSRSTCSDWSDSSNDERGSRKRHKLEPQRSGVDRRRKRRGRSPSRSSSCSTFSRSSHESPNQQGSIAYVAKKMEESYGNENNSETMQSYDDYPSSKSNKSNDNVERVGQIKSADCHKLPASTDNKNDLSKGGESKSDGQVEAMLRQKALENLAKFRNKRVATTKESSKLDEEGAAIVNSEKFDNDEPVRRPLRLRSVVVAANVNNELSTVEAGSVVVAANVNNELPTFEADEKVLCGEPSIAKVDQVVHAANGHEVASRSNNSIKADEPGAPAPESILPDNNKAVSGTFSGSKVEADGGNQLQLKTMNVMRGGELVQVTYKVHIPKTTPALARRRLQRGK